MKDTRIERLDVFAYTVPTDGPESDGTYEWSSTTMVLVEAHAGGRAGIGFTYTHASAAALIRHHLADQVLGTDAMDVSSAWFAMHQSVRNFGSRGLAAAAISAVDMALWDLKARLLEVPLVSLFGQLRDSVPIYGSGGFTSYPVERLSEQLGSWAASGMRFVKMKIGRDAAADLRRVEAARNAIGDRAELFVDANGAYDRKQAVAMAAGFADHDVKWFEEPVSSDDLEGLRLIRDRAPAGMNVSAGEYGYDLFYFRRMLEAGAVDVLQADATRCGGFTTFLKAAALCEASAIPLSSHTAPALHAHIACAVRPLRHVEYFHDHVRIEAMFFDGVLEPVNGTLTPDLTRVGNGLELKRADAAPFAVV